MNEQVSAETLAIGREIDHAELMVRALEDISKRLDDAKAEHITPAQQAQYSKLQERLFELSK